MLILVVDDSPLMRRYVERTLKMIDPAIQVTEAEDGASAMRAARRAPPDLIITDLNMPVMNGRELIEALSRDALLAAIPVLIVSADHSETESQELRDEGAAGFLTKPVTPEQLRQHLAEILPAGGTHAEHDPAADPASEAIV